MKAIIIAFLSVVSISAWASSPIPVLSYLDANVAGGFSTHSVQTSATHPKMGQFGMGIALGAEVWRGIMVGANSDYRFINHYSDVTKLVGNSRGNRWNYVAPMIGYKAGRFTLKGDFQFLGDYNLSNKTSKNEEVKYKKPLGGRLAVMYQLPQFWIYNLEGLHAGLYGEYLAFGKLWTTNAGERDMTTHLKLWQFGATVAWSFFYLYPP